MPYCHRRTIASTGKVFRGPTMRARDTTPMDDSASALSKSVRARRVVPVAPGPSDPIMILADRCDPRAASTARTPRPIGGNGHLRDGHGAHRPRLRRAGRGPTEWSTA